MKHWKKLLALALSAACLVCVLAACGTATEEPTPEQESIASTTSTDGEPLVMATNATFPPYEFLDEQNKIVGIDPEIAQAVAEKLGRPLEMKDMAFDSLIPALQAGSCDVVLAGMTVDPERLESVNFSDTYAGGVQVIIVPEDSDIASVDDLDGKQIGVQSGTTGDIYATNDYGQSNVKQYESGPLAIAALQNGQIDCVIIDNEPAKNYVQANEGLKILDTEYAVEEYAIAVNKNDEELLEQINVALAELKADGKLQEIIDNYIKAE